MLGFDWSSMSSAIIGGLLTAGGAWWQDWRRNRADGSALQMALAMEVSSLITLIRGNNYARNIRASATVFRQGLLPTPPFPTIHASHRYFSVFESNADRIGTLPDALPAYTVAFYQGARSLLDTLHKDERANWADRPIEEQALVCEQIANRIDNLCVVGDRILSLLRAVGADPKLGEAVELMLGTDRSSN